MSTRDQDYRSGACREAVVDLIFSGRFPSERHVELLLDRLEREGAGPSDREQGGGR